MLLTIYEVSLKNTHFRQNHAFPMRLHVSVKVTDIVVERIEFELDQVAAL